MVSFHACIFAEGSPTSAAANADCAATANIAAHLRKKVYSAERLKAEVTVSDFALCKQPDESSRILRLSVPNFHVSDD